MKKITLLLLFISAMIYSQAPTVDPNTPPARDAADVISIFSSEYSDVSGTDFNPNWGQSGHASANTSYDTGSGNIVLAYPNFNYQGIQFGSSQNISAMEKLHVDIWVDGTFDPRVFVISSGTEIPHTITNTGAASWISVDIDVSGITGDLSNAIQFKFDGGDGGAIYLDNLYFWKNPTSSATDATLSDLQVNGVTLSGFNSAVEDYTYEVPPGDPTPTISATTSQAGASASITQASAVPGDATVLVTAEDGTTTKEYTVSFIVDPTPTTGAPTPPSFDAANVISIYSDSFTNVSSNFDAGWCGGNSVEEVVINSNNTMKYLNNACQGIDFAGDRKNATSFNRIHIDFYTTETNLDGKVFNLKLVDFGDSGGTAEIANVEVNLNSGSTPAIVSGSWVSIDVPVDLSTFTGLAQAAITSNLNGNVWYDNFYVYVDGTAGVDNNDLLGFSMFPNPSKDRLNISAKNTIEKAEIYNVLGKKVMTFTINKNSESLDVSNLTSGIYLIKYTVNDKVGTSKFVKQ